jgi:hypothetical protein
MVSYDSIQCAYFKYVLFGVVESVHDTCSMIARYAKHARVQRNEIVTLTKTR